MKKLFIGVNVFVVWMLFSGCASKELQTTNYFDALTKDEILDAGKLVFLNDSKTEYIIDSYRDRLEVTKIGIVFHTLTHEDFVLNVEENECGTNATLKMTSNYGVDKILNHDAFELEHQYFWYKLESIIEDKQEQLEENLKLAQLSNETAEQTTQNSKDAEIKSIIKPTKDLSQCEIKNEFDYGVIKNKTSRIGEIDDEEL